MTGLATGADFARFVLVSLLLHFVFVSQPAVSQESLADLAPFREGCEALADERFETAATRFRECWGLVRDSEGGGPEADFVASRLLEALVRDGSAAAAVAWLAESEGFQPAPSTSFWVAAAYQAEERFAEAAEHYQIHLAARPHPSTATVFNRAVCLARSGEPEAAYELARDFPPSSPGQTLCLARLAAAASREAEALTLIQSIDLSDSAAEGLRLPCARLRAAILLGQGKRSEAHNLLYETVAASPNGDSARRALLLLEVFLEGEKPAGLADRLAAWAGDAAFPGREAAALYRTILLEEEPVRGEALRAYASAAADPVLKLEARSRLLSEGSDASAAAAPEGLPGDLRERLDFSFAASAYQGGRFDEAMRRFSELAEKDRGEDAARDLFNAAIAALRQDDVAAFATFEKALALRHPKSIHLANLGYLGGLFFAAKGSPDAFERLDRFVKEHPDHAAWSDAQLALAEIHLNQAPARPREAREIFEVLRTRPLTLLQSERLDYASVWIERIDGDGPALLRRAEEFVANWPGSAYLGEILMILASEFYAERNLVAAAASFRRVAEQFPDSPLAGTARFFEAKASPASEETVSKWRALVEAGGALAHEAAHELGLLYLSLDRFGEARAEFARLLEGLPAQAPLRFAVMADLAYAHYLEALAADKDPAKLTEAADHFATLSGLDAAPVIWRYNAAVRRGKCLEALGKPTVALEIYRSIVDETQSGGEGAISPLSPGETEWVFRAGFAAIEILNAERNWAAAIEVADALSEKSGSRAIEASQLAEQLRLKHWVWD